jgi:hypothetical protein
MVNDGAWLGHCDGSLSRLGWVLVDEPKKCLFFMRRWAQGTGDAHVFRWGSYTRDTHYVNFTARTAS